MGYSHRDRRAHRDVRRDFEIVLAATLALGIAALVLPWSVASIAALLALGILGAVSIVRAERLLREYALDLERGRAGGGGSGLLRAEVANEVGLDRQIVRPSASSPHRRRRPLVRDPLVTDRRPAEDP